MLLAQIVPTPPPVPVPVPVPETTPVEWLMANGVGVAIIAAFLLLLILAARKVFGRRRAPELEQ